MIVEQRTMISDVLLKNDFFYDEGTLTPDEMAILTSRISDKNCGVSTTEVPVKVSKLLPVHRYSGRYYHLYRTLHQLMTQTYRELVCMRADELTAADVVWTQADLFDTLGLPMTKENIMSNVI